MLKVFATSVFLAFLYSSAGRADDLIVQLRSQPGAVNGEPLYVDGGLVGLVGDAFRLSSGQHEARFSGKYGYSFRLTLEVSREAASVSAHEARRWGDCVGDRVDHHVVQEWHSPEVRKLQDGGLTRWEVVVPDPSYLQEGGPNSDCVLLKGMVKLRELGSVALAISSIPVGAAVYINGRKSAATNTTLAVPFFENQKTIRVLLRKPGYVTCGAEISTEINHNSVSCTLVALPTPHGS